MYMNGFMKFWSHILPILEIAFVSDYEGRRDKDHQDKGESNKRENMSLSSIGATMSTS